MPLLDHFHPPLQKTWTWESFHATWAVELAGMLNDGLLPPSFVALPLTQVGTRVEIDVATLNGSGAAVPPQGAGGAATVAAVWAPPQPILDVPIDFTHLDLFEVQIRREDDSFRLAAAIELVSPGNKDRESHRRAFAIKCANYLQEGVGLLVVDVVTHRSGDLHGDLLALPGLTAPPGGAAPSDLYAAAYRTAGPAEASRLRAWREVLALDAPLPKMPLWILEERFVPVDLEAAYSAARRRLAMR
jgi:hypothetical protein